MSHPVSSGRPAPYFPHPLSTSLYPGDSIISDPSMRYDQYTTLPHRGSEIFPWLMQLGKGRAGWYIPTSWDRIIGFVWSGWSTREAARELKPEWQHLQVGQVVPDYGFGGDEDSFTVVEVDRERGVLVYQSERYGCTFTWTLMVHQHPRSEIIKASPSQEASRDFISGSGNNEPIWTTVHLRFRGRMQATGLKRMLIVWGGGIMDHLSTAPMLKGLAERVRDSQKKIVKDSPPLAFMPAENS